LPANSRIGRGLELLTLYKSQIGIEKKLQLSEGPGYCEQHFSKKSRKDISNNRWESSPTRKTAKRSLTSVPGSNEGYV
jgi:hypothetical protein